MEEKAMNAKTAHEDVKKKISNVCSCEWFCTFENRNADILRIHKLLTSA